MDQNNSSYIQDELGGKIIAASQRPDGTWRKPRRVREGYVPQDEVPLYESKGKQFVKSQPKYPVGYNPVSASEERNKTIQPIPGLIIDTETKSNKKKKKKKGTTQPPPASLDPNEIISNICEESVKNSISNEFSEVKSKKKRSKAGAASDVNQISSTLSKLEVTSNSQETPKKTINNKSSPTTESVLQDPSKRLKNLQKKLREIETIEERIRKGNLKNPEKDQLEKIKRKSEIVSEIESLTYILQE